MKLKIKNEDIKHAVAFEAAQNIFGSGIQENGELFGKSPLQDTAMSILWGYVHSLHEISEMKEVHTNIDLTYQTVQNVMETVVWEFSVGMNPKSGYSVEKNIEIAEKTLAAYFMFLAMNDDKANLIVSAQPNLSDLEKPDCWAGVQIQLSNRFMRRDLLKDIHGSVTFADGVLTINADKLISSYKTVTGKDLSKYGVDSMQGYYQP